MIRTAVLAPTLALVAIALVAIGEAAIVVGGIAVLTILAAWVHGGPKGMGGDGP